MINISLDSLLSTLNKIGYPAELQAQTDQVYTVLKVSGQEFPLFFRIYHETDFLQLLAFIPCELKKQYVADLARFLLMLNKEIDLPGFGMDEVAGAVFYRLMIPVHKKEIPADLLKQLVNTIENVCKMFATPIQAVAYGSTTLDQILKKANDLGSKQQIDGMP